MSADPASVDSAPPKALVGDTEAALTFLRAFHPERDWVLTAIDPEKKGIVTKSFAPGADQLDCALTFIDKWNGRRNLYFGVNQPLHPLSKKAERADIKAVHYLHVDVDPRAGEDLAEEQQRARLLCTDNLPEGVPEPTFVVFSGGGYQAFWRLETPIVIDGDLDKAEDAKLYNVRLERLFGADACHDISRIMRLPGTVNLPDEKKRKKGRSPALARLVAAPNYTYANSFFTKAEPDRGDPHQAHPPAAVALSGEATRLDSVDDLDKWNVPDRVRVVIVQGQDPDNPKEGDNSRSGWLFDVCCNLVRCGVPDEVVLGVITDPDFLISESVLEKGSGTRRYALRNIERAKAEALWEFQRPGEGKPPTKNLHNARLAVVKLGVVTEFDEFRKKLLLGGHELSETAAPVTDRALLHLRQLILEKFRFDTGKDFLDDAVRQLCFENAFDPILDYLGGLVWDGEPRLDGWLVRYMGAPDKEYMRAVGRLLLVAAVRRARRPGCKFDTIVVLEGPQGSGKSTALSILAGHPDFFSDQDILAVDPKQQAELMEGVWLYEIAELEGMSRAETSKVKAFASRQVDRARPAYGRHREDNPRRCVFVGTCNESQYLRDRTGNRRFLPVETSEIDLAGLRRDRDQLWAEAAAAEAEDASIELPRTLWSVAAEIQEERVADDPWQARLHDLTKPEYPFEAMPKGLAVHGDELRIFTGDVLHWLGVETGQQHEGHGKRLGPLMRKLGWEGPKVMRIGGVAGRGYRKRRECDGSPEAPATPESQTEIDL